MVKKEINEIKNIKNLEIKTRTSVAAYHQYNYLLARENLTDHLEAKDKKIKLDKDFLKLEQKKLFCNRCFRKTTLIFNNNDRPGIMLSSAVKKYSNFYGVACGSKKCFIY